MDSRSCLSRGGGKPKESSTSGGLTLEAIVVGGTSPSQVAKDTAGGGEMVFIGQKEGQTRVSIKEKGAGPGERHNQL